VGGDELGAAAYEPDGLHAGVGEEGVARELRQALDAVLHHEKVLTLMMIKLSIKP
jgi:hypothetical protein